MFAVIKTGGKQYKVAKDDVLTIERVPGDKGAKVSFGEVLMVGGVGQTKLGSPMISGAVVEGEIVEHGRADKILVVKKRRRKGYHRKNGHRQGFTKVKIVALPA